MVEEEWEEEVNEEVLELPDVVQKTKDSAGSAVEEVGLSLIPLTSMKSSSRREDSLVRILQRTS